MPVPPFPPTPWLPLLGGAIALIVSLIAFLVASGLPNGQPPHSRL
jgi:hypothetical protein